MIINIYQEALKRIPENDIDHYASDLYLRKTPETEKLIQEYKYKNLVSTFVDNIDHVVWYDIPFAYRK